MVSEAEMSTMLMRYRRSMVNSLLEYLILTYVEKGNLCGYDIITLLHDRFRVLLSPGQVYPVIDDMAQHGLLSKEKRGRMVLLGITHMGTSLLAAWRAEMGLIQMQLGNIVTEKIAST